MKLLNLQSSQDAANAEEARGILRTQALFEAEKDARLALARAEADFNDTLAEHRKKWEKEESTHRERMVEMKKELQDAETERLEMLVPFAVLKEGTDSRFKDAESFLNGLRRRESKIEELTELLEDKLDEAMEREVDLKQREEMFILKQKGLDSQLESAKAQSEELTTQIGKFRLEKESMEKKLADRENAVVLRERSADAAEQGMIEKEKELKNREILLLDQRGVLERAWKEFRQMRGF